MNKVIEKMQKCFSYDTCHHSYQHRWSPNLPSVGHCAIASLLLNEQYGFPVYKTKVGNSTHYYNIDGNGMVVDVTANQFEKEIPYEKGILCNPQSMLKVQDTKERYEKLKNRFLDLEV